MPSKGFKSLTLPDVVYDTLFTNFHKNKAQLKLKGIFSLSAYVTCLLESELNNSTTKRKLVQRIPIE